MSKEIGSASPSRLAELVVLIMYLSVDVHLLKEENKHLEDRIVHLTQSLHWLSEMTVTVLVTLFALAISLLLRG